MSFTSKAALSEAKRSKEYFETSAPTICFSLVWMKMHGFMPGVLSSFGLRQTSTIPVFRSQSGAKIQRSERKVMRPHPLSKQSVDGPPAKSGGGECCQVIPHHRGGESVPVPTKRSIVQHRWKGLQIKTER